MKLTAKAVSAARYDGSVRKLYDGGGLYLRVGPASNSWRYSYRRDGKAREFTIGPADTISLSDARERHRTAKWLVLDGLDPVAERHAESGRRRAAQDVGSLVDDWHERGSRTWAKSNAVKILSRLRRLSPAFRARRLHEVTADDVLAELERARDAVSGDLAHRLKTYLRDAFDDALGDEQIVANPARHPKVAKRLGPMPAQEAYAHITDVAVLADVLRTVEDYPGDRSIGEVLWLSPRLFCRPGEIRGLLWSEVDLDRAQLVIGAQRMKAKREHVIPLAPPCLARIQAMPRVGEHVFPAPRRASRPLSSNTISMAMGRLGISAATIVPHGCRHTASSFLNEREFVVDGEAVRFAPDAIEAQLAHATKGVRGVYNRAEYMDERRRMMTAWADWLDALVRA